MFYLSRFRSVFAYNMLGWLMGGEAKPYSRPLWYGEWFLSLKCLS